MSRKWSLIEKISAGVISGIILIIVNWMLSFGIFSKIDLVTKYLRDVSTKHFSFSISFWVICLAFFIILLSFKIVVAIKNKINRKPDYLAYTKDKISGINWEWRYDYSYSIISDSLLPLCPNCSYELLSKNISQFRVVEMIIMQCHRCGFRSSEFGVSYYGLRDLVVKEIERKIRTSEFKFIKQ